MAGHRPFMCPAKELTRNQILKRNERVLLGAGNLALGWYVEAGPAGCGVGACVNFFRAFPQHRNLRR
jgi:hypothetical protein